jgi:tripartite-type tricarboxylate transporter receptor subunit TctC
MKTMDNRSDPSDSGGRFTVKSSVLERPVKVTGTRVWKGIASLCMLLTLMAVPLESRSQAYPSRPIKLISPLAAGGTGDTLARLLGAQMAKVLGQPVVVDARPGAGGQVGLEAVAKAPPDGYTLAITASAVVIIPAQRPNAGFDALTDFEPIGLVANTSQVLVVNAASPYKTLAELLAYAKANPGRLNYGSSGDGSLTHLNTELLKQMAGVFIVHVPYRGSTFARNGLLGGEVDFVVDGLMPALPLIKDGRLRALGLLDSTRSSSAPDIPTVAQAGVKGFASDTWYGLLAPAGTPKEVIQALHAAMVEVARSPEFRAALAGQGVQLAVSSPAEFRTVLQREKTRWTSVIKYIGSK